MACPGLLIAGPAPPGAGALPGSSPEREGRRVSAGVVAGTLRRGQAELPRYRASRNESRNSMSKLNRRAMLRQSSTLAAAAAALIPGPNVWAQQMPREPDRKLRIVAVGGHCDDPQTCAGGTLTLYADQGHEVVGLSITGGPMPPPGTDPEDRKFKDRLNCQKMADILKIRLDCLNYSGSNSGQFKLPIIWRGLGNRRTAI